ncbi:class IV lanthionine synthetase LanL [Streptomyces sp. Lzd4kr]|nr:class IV lanthionine synthetase LanL [Streptomyces sp. Lzd4kr]
MIASEGNESIANAADSLLLDVVRGVLNRGGGQRWTVRPTKPWCYVMPQVKVQRLHGWKLHVSATPLSAPLVLARAAEALVDLQCSFKFATDIRRVRELVGVWYDRGGAGKFITAYPRDDDQFRAVAERLDRVTRGLPGPRILSDKPLRQESLVHYRYGGFSPDRVFTDDGSFEARLTDPHGNEVKDERRAWYSPPAWVTSPFPEESEFYSAVPESVLLGGRFVVKTAIRHANKGGVFRAIDQRDGTSVIIKQARAHVGSLLDGTDARDRLRDEADMLDTLQPLNVVPGKRTLFHEQGDLFLVEDLVPGTTLATWANDRAKAGGPSTADAVAMAQRLIALVGRVHEAGFVIRDIKPANVMLLPTGELQLIDVEHVVVEGQPSRPIGTTGFMAPEVVVAARDRSRPAAQREWDYYSLGASLFFLATALAPIWGGGRESTRPDPGELRATLAQLSMTYPALAALTQVILGLTEERPENRWALDRAQEHLTGSSPSTGFAQVALRLGAAQQERLLTDGLRQLSDSMTPDADHLWKPERRAADNDVCCAQTGAAGPLSVLTQAARLCDAEGNFRDTVARAAAWVDRRLFTIPRLLPGLYFGRAGTAWALHDAAVLLDDEAMAARALDLARKLPERGPSPDITHGLAGAGLAHIQLWNASAEPDLLQRALRYGDSLLAMAHRSGDDWSWPTPDGIDSKLAGNHTHGFAHGTAGVGAFLLALGDVAAAEGDVTTRAHRYQDAALAAGHTLARAAHRTDEGTWWPIVVGVEQATPRRGLHWCNGAAGIGSFLLRLGAATQDQTFTDLAVEAATHSLKFLWREPAGACCGLAGIGHLLLDLSDHTKDEAHRHRAEEIANVIHAQRFIVDGRHLTHPATGPYDQGSGMAGVLGFLLRLHHGGPRPWMPSAPDGRK